MTPFPESDAYLAWGRAHRARHRVAQPVSPAAARAALGARGTLHVLAFGLGRSYGDSCLNPDGLLVDMRGLDRFLAFDADSGRLVCEAGLSLAAILATLAARPAPGGGIWFLPVSPGTRSVTVGGAIANDVHGKNHETQGTFGRHLLELELLRSDGSVVTCAPDRNGELFRATIGGLGLTGLILRATLQLRRVPGPLLEVEDLRFPDLDGFYRLAAESAAFEYTAAWIDCLATGAATGRGIFSRARHLAAPAEAIPPPRPARLRVPLAPPVSPLNRATLGAFNALYWRRLRGAAQRRSVRPYPAVLHPLDSIADWNRLYGRRGFYQYQCAIPEAVAPPTVRRLLETIAAAGEGSFLAVLKTFGALASPGMLSFPMPGSTLALDFPNRGPATLALLDRLDAIVLEAGGRLYPAKDGRMPASTFRAGYPAWRTFAQHVDPAFSSGLWRRVCGGGSAALGRVA